MKRGDAVKVRAFPNQSLDRIVWHEYNTYVLVVRPTVYHTALHAGGEPAGMGFPKEDVLPLIAPTEADNVEVDE